MHDILKDWACSNTTVRPHITRSAKQEGRMRRQTACSDRRARLGIICMIRPFLVMGAAHTTNNGT